MTAMMPLRLAGGVLLFAVMSAGAATAQNYPWCANFADGAGANCGFTTYAQCMATSQGSGGSCEKNNAYRPDAAAMPARHPPRRHRSAKSS